jgi:ribose 5-phosphate isomerase B
VTMTSADSASPPRRLKVALGCDEAAYELKEVLKHHLEGQGIETEDFGVQAGQTALYPDVAFAVAEQVAAGVFERAILLCGTGIGVAISANKVPGVRAAQAHDTYSAERARKSNNAQIITLGARVIGSELAKSVVDAFLRSEFEGGRSSAKVDRINAYDEEHRQVRLLAPERETSGC